MDVRLEAPLCYLFAQGKSIKVLGKAGMAREKKALVLFPGALGDFICFIPALETMRRSQEVDLLARSEYAGLLAPHLRFRSIECYPISRLFCGDAADEEPLRHFFAPYGYVYSWMGSKEPGFVSALRRVFAGELRCFPFRPQARIHAVDYYLACVGGHYAFESMRRILCLSPEVQKWARTFFAHHGLAERKVMVLAPGSGARQKNWPAVRHKELVKWWERQARGVVVTVLGPAEEENEEILQQFAAEPHVLRGLEVEKIAAVIGQCQLYVGNDSGLTHLAAALGVKTVAVFGPTDPTCWAPRGAHVKTVYLGVECSPCDVPTMKACAHRRCLTGLSSTVAASLVEDYKNCECLGHQRAAPP